MHKQCVTSFKRLAKHDGKDTALGNIFGTYDSPVPERFILLLQTLQKITSSKEFDHKATYEASALYEKWIKFETILTAFVFMRLFQYSTPVSKYLQTKGLDVMTAYRMTQSLGKSIYNIRETFGDTHRKAKEFALSVINEGYGVAAELNETRFRKRKRLTIDAGQDEVESLGTAIARFEIDPYKTTLDIAATEIDRRFSKNEDLYKDIALLEPRRFQEVEEQLRNDPKLFSKIAKMSEVNLAQLRQELQSFTQVYKEISSAAVIEMASGGIFEEESAQVQVQVDMEVSEQSEEEANTGIPPATTSLKAATTCLEGSKPCQVCVPCAFKTLHMYNMHVSSYPALYVAYKIVMTLSRTQVSCERLFSKLKIIKSRL